MHISRERLVEIMTDNVENLSNEQLAKCAVFLVQSDSIRYDEAEDDFVLVFEEE